MNCRHPRSFRGLHALIEHPPGTRPHGAEEPARVPRAARHCSRLRHRPPPPSQSTSSSSTPTAARQRSSGEVHRELDLPVVALIGSETPTRLQAMLARQPSAYLMKPIRSTGIYASLAIATHQFATLQAMRRKLASAEERLRSRRLLLAATLQIMNQAQVGEDEAFHILRRTAMSHRQTVEALSAQILAGEFPLPRSARWLDVSQARE